MQLPIKDNVTFKLADFKQNGSSADKFTQPPEMNAITDENNPLISQVVFFARMFEKFVNEDAQAKQGQVQQESYTDPNKLKEVIYRTYSKSIDTGKEKKKSEKKKMKKIMNLLIYLQMKKVEMKLNYFNEFEKLIQFESQQIKTMESQIIQDRIKLAIKKSELLLLNNKVKELLKSGERQENETFKERGMQGDGESNHISNGHNEKLNEKVNSLKIESEPRILELN